MLSNALIRKKYLIHLPLLSAFLFLGCGKKFTESKKEETQRRAPALSTSKVELANDGSSIQRYAFPDLGEVYLPAKLDFHSGDPETDTKVFFSGGNPSEEFFCLYGFKRDTEYALVNCYYDGYPLSYQAGDRVVQTQGQEIWIENSEAKVSGEFEIDWH